jgi:hypothetical protein
MCKTVHLIPSYLVKDVRASLPKDHRKDIFNSGRVQRLQVFVSAQETAQATVSFTGR